MTFSKIETFGEIYRAGGAARGRVEGQIYKSSSWESFGVSSAPGVSGVSDVSDLSLTRFPDLLNDSHWNVNQSWTSCWMVDPSSFFFLC